ncbi:MAG: Gx transporter family protein, partial [Oscillospiraceae bacterium]
ALMLLMLLKKAPPMFIMSVTGAIMHNIGQLLALRFLVTTSPYTIYYLPILLISGVIMGALTSVSLQAVLPALAKLGIEKKH